MKQKFGIIGTGISGLSAAQLLKDDHDVEIFEKNTSPGGLIRCESIQGNTYHVVGGHIFNSKRQDVLDWFWRFFDKSSEFIPSKRNAAAMFSEPVGYPVEDHLKQLGPEIAKCVIAELIELEKSPPSQAANFEEFLRSRFGKTLYEIYFSPYNKKIWKRDLSKVPLEWLAGKLPMPTVQEILYNNITHEEEQKMVHSSFFYPQNSGSQFIADRLSKGLNINFECPVESIVNKDGKWHINDSKGFDRLVYTGNIKLLPKVLPGDELSRFQKQIETLDYHGTTTVLCHIKANDYSWLYLPDTSFDAHRIIVTGNFSNTNNQGHNLSATIEFTDKMEKEEIDKQLSKMPFSPKYITHRYTEFTYPIQDSGTRNLIQNLKSILEPKGIYLLGRFAEWEYYNMDTAIGAAIDLKKRAFQDLR